MSAFSLGLVFVLVAVLSLYTGWYSFSRPESYLNWAFSHSVITLSDPPSAATVTLARVFGVLFALAGVLSLLLGALFLL